MISISQAGGIKWAQKASDFPRPDFRNWRKVLLALAGNSNLNTPKSLTHPPKWLINPPKWLTNPSKWLINFTNWLVHPKNVLEVIRLTAEIWIPRQIILSVNFAAFTIGEFRRHLSSPVTCLCFDLQKILSWMKCSFDIPLIPRYNDIFWEITLSVRNLLWQQGGKNSDAFWAHFKHLL